MPVFIANLDQQLYTTRNGPTYPPIKLTQEAPGRKKLTQPGQILALLHVFFCGWYTSATFHNMWTNGEALTN